MPKMRKVFRIRGVVPILLSNVLLALAATSACARETRAGETNLLNRRVTIGESAYDYQVFVPPGGSSNKKLPVILFLHGIGQRGEGGIVPTEGAAGALVQSYLERVPSIVVLPQCRKGVYWSDPQMEAQAIGALNQSVKEFGGDPTRMYLTGVSMGGYGAWHLAARHPGKFAALVPVCGGSPLHSADRYTAIAQKVGRTPTWVFHGSDDRVVPVTESRRMVEALKAAGGNVHYTEYEGAGHNVWNRAYTEPDFLPWLLAQRLQR